MHRKKARCPGALGVFRYTLGVQLHFTIDLQKIVVHEKEVKWSKHAPQTIEIHYVDIGCTENGKTAEPEQHKESQMAS